MQPSRIRHGKKRRQIEKEQQARLYRIQLAFRIHEHRMRKRQANLYGDVDGTPATGWGWKEA